jgi:phage tail tape-measure protein
MRYKVKLTNQSLWSRAMESFEELRISLENDMEETRKKLNAAMEDGYVESIVLPLSRQMDELLERYHDLRKLERLNSRSLVQN